MTIPAESALKTCTSMPSRSLQDVGREEGEREVAEHDRRDAGQHLEHRLERLADARARVLAQVDRRAEAERDRDQQGDRR